MINQMIKYYFYPFSFFEVPVSLGMLALFATSFFMKIPNVVYLRVKIAEIAGFGKLAIFGNFRNFISYVLS
jgi:hypothetical protein